MSADNRRLEELTLNSSAPPGQLLYDGWLLRLAPGKAKRARSVNAIYDSTRPLEQKIGYCESLYAAAGMPALFRITPFSKPPGLETELERRGYERFEPTAVESAPLESRPESVEGVRACALGRWIDAVADLRGSPLAQRDAHLARLEGLPLAKVALAIEEAGRIVATGLAIVEDGHVGLFDVATRADARRRGLARRLVSALLRAGFDQGARTAYLQVECDNAPARRLYARFGFEERYRYWYRVKPA